MPKIKQLSILIIFFSLIFLLTGCGPVKPKDDIKSLPEDAAKLLEEESGIKFAHFLVHLNNTSVLFSRMDTDDDGNKLYETTKLDPTSPEPVSELNGQVTYSKTNIIAGDVIKINNIVFSHCDYVNIGSNASLVCKASENSEFLHFNNENDVIPDLVVEEIEEEIGEELSWLVLSGRQEEGGLKSKLMIKGGYAIFDASTVFDTEIKLDLSKRLNVKTIFAIENPCKCIVDDGDIVYVTYKIICP